MIRMLNCWVGWSLTSSGLIVFLIRRLIKNCPKMLEEVSVVVKQTWYSIAYSRLASLRGKKRATFRKI